MIVLTLIGCLSTDSPVVDSEPQDDSEEVFPEPFTGRLEIEHQDLTREYHLHIPDGLPAGAPLVVVMHGYTSSAETIMGYSGFNDLADQQGFAVVYPQGTVDQWGNNFFNVGYEFHEGITVDDVSFISAVVSHLQQSQGLSDRNVFATGMSNGAEMSYVLACEASEHFKAIAPVAGIIMEVQYNNCQPEFPLPVFEIHGTSDDVSWYEGDMENEDGWGAYPGTDTVIGFWADLSGLDQTENTELPDLDPGDGSTVTFHRHFSSATPNQVWLYKVEGGGHDWPGVFGNNDIDSTKEIWGFFSMYLD